MRREQEFTAFGGATLWINQGNGEFITRDIENGTNGGDGNFTDSGQRLGQSDSSAAALGDLDGDGDLDALVAQAREATIWWNNGQATFTRSDRRFRYRRDQAPAAGDFNGDARPDIFAANHEDAYRIWFNHGQGAFNSTRPNSELH